MAQFDPCEVIAGRHERPYACRGDVEKAFDPCVAAQRKCLADERHGHRHRRDEEEVTDAAQGQRRLRRRDHCGEGPITVKSGKAEAAEF